MKKPNVPDSKDEASGDPWPLLLLAAPFFAFGLVLLQRGHGRIGSFMVAGWINGGRISNAIDLSEGEVHAFGLAGLLVGLAIIGFYFYARRNTGRRKPPKI